MCSTQKGEFMGKKTREFQDLLQNASLHGCSVALSISTYQSEKLLGKYFFLTFCFDGKFQISSFFLSLLMMLILATSLVKFFEKSGLLFTKQTSGQSWPQKFWLISFFIMLKNKYKKTISYTFNQ